MFGVGALPNQNSLAQMKCGKMNIEGTTVTSDPRKGLLVLRKAEDGLMHLIWKDRQANSVVDDLIVFEGDATIRQLDECKDGFALLLEFSQTARKLFFYSQEPRKKGLAWTAEDTAKEKELVDKINSILTGGPSAAAPASGPAGALGMTHSELLAMLGGTAVPPAAPSPAPSSSEPSAPAPASGNAAPAPSAAPNAAFSADAISSILSGIPAAAPGAAAGAPTFSADNISSILGGINPGGAAGGPPVSLNDVLRPEDAVPRMDAGMEASLAEHLPQGGSIPESAAATLSTPQMAQASTDAEQAAKAKKDEEDGVEKMDES